MESNTFNKSRISLKELLEIAKSQIKNLSTLSDPDFRLEQAEYKEDEGMWDIIVSFLVQNTNKRTAPAAMLTSDFQFHRLYKRIKINDNKEFIGLYMYNDK